MKDKLTEKLLASLKRHNPSKVRAWAGDDDSRDIAVPTRRRRWSQVIEAIEARAWTRVELLDKAGAVLGYVDNVEPAGELQELTSDKPGTATEVQRLLQMVLAATERGVAMHVSSRDAEVRALLDAQGAVVREMVAGMHALTAMYREQVDAASDVAALTERAAATEGGGGGQLKELLDAAPQLLQMLPLLKGMLGSGSGEQRAPNGTRKQ